MDKYVCKDCNETFRSYGIHIPTSYGDNTITESTLVKVLKAYCPSCGSFNIDLTEHGKLLIERQKKIERLNEISKK